MNDCPVPRGQGTEPGPGHRGKARRLQVFLDNTVLLKFQILMIFNHLIPGLNQLGYSAQILTSSTHPCRLCRQKKRRKRYVWTCPFPAAAPERALSRAGIVLDQQLWKSASVILERTWRVLWLLLCPGATHDKCLPDLPGLTFLSGCQIHRTVRYLLYLQYLILPRSVFPPWCCCITVSPLCSAYPTQSLLFALPCFATKAHVLGRIIAPRHGVLPHGIFAVISHGFGPQLLQHKWQQKWISSEKERKNHVQFKAPFFDWFEEFLLLCPSPGITAHTQLLLS